MLRSLTGRSLWAPVRFWAVAGVLGLLWSVPSRGDQVPLSIDPNGPQVLSLGSMGDSLVYDASSGDFNVQTTLLFYQSASLSVPAYIDSALATIDLNVDQNGTLQGTGTFNLTGGIDFDGDGTDDVTGYSSPGLLTGTVTAFGAASPGPAPWEFDGLITITGGALTAPSIPLSSGGTFSDLFQVGSVVGFDLTVESGTTGILGDFISDFSGTSIKGPDPGVLTPEPNTALVVAVVLAAAGGAYSLRRPVFPGGSSA